MKCWGTALFSLLLLFSGTLAQSPPYSPRQIPRSDPPQTIIRPQPDASLRVASAETKWAAFSDGISIFILVENVGERTIRAFATRRDKTGAGTSGCFLNNLMPGKVLRPGQKDGKTTWQGYSQSGPPMIWVDFIEFADGSTWGADECHCLDRLSGERAGARAIRELLLQLLTKGGPDEVLKFLRERDEKIKAARARGDSLDEERLSSFDPPPGHSLIFDEGFRFGASTMIGRVEVANEYWGASEIEAALRRPYDASEVK
jgi:hypothetical protein